MAEKRYGKNQITAKQENVTLIKSMIYKEGPIPRARIAEKLSLTPATVTNIVAEMIEQGLVREIQEDPADGKVGRHPIMLDFNAQSVYAMGISLGRDLTHYCICDLRGNPVLKGTCEVMPDDYDAMLEKLYEIIDPVIRKKKIRQKLVGIGVAVPGITDAHIGVIRQTDTERESWKDKPLAETLIEKYGLPVRVENNVRARTNMISLFMPDVIKGYVTFCLCYASWGIACPIILKNESVRGEGGAAGEIGHMIMDPETGATLEEYASLKSVLELCRQAMREGKAPRLSELCETPEELTIEQIHEAQRRKDPAVTEIMERAMRYIGIALSNIVSFMNPELIILSGPVFTEEENRAYAEKVMRKYAYSADISHTAVKHVEFSDYGGAAAAAASCLDKYFVR